MTDNNHPITPPEGLVREWAMNATLSFPEDERIETDIVRDRMIAKIAARWGADQELEACIAWMMKMGYWGDDGKAIPALRAARRPKPPSLKEQAKFAAAVLRSPDETCSIAELQQHWHTICNALESLPD